MNNKSISILAMVVCLAAMAGCAAKGGTPGDTVQIGGDVDSLQKLLAADPRYANSTVAMELGNDASGGMVEWVEIVLEDSQCPARDATACADVINGAVRIVLTTPTIDTHPGIQVTLQSFLPKRDYNGYVITPGKPPLAKHTLDEWRGLLKP